MEKEKVKKRKDFAEKSSVQKSQKDDFNQKVRAAYSAMGKLGGQARAKQLAEKGFTTETKPPKKSKASTTTKGEE